MKKRPLRIMEIMDATGMGIVALGGEVDPRFVFRGIAMPGADDVKEADVVLGSNEPDVTFLSDSTTMVWRTREVCTVVAVTVLVTWRVIVGTSEKPLLNGLGLFPSLLSSKSPLAPKLLLLILLLPLPLSRLFLLECLLVVVQGAISRSSVQK